MSDSKHKRLVKATSSVIAIVNIHKKETSFGPPIEMRSSPKELCGKLSFTPLKPIDLNKYFYMQLFTAGRKKTC